MRYSHRTHDTVLRWSKSLSDLLPEQLNVLSYCRTTVSDRGLCPINLGCDVSCLTGVSCDVSYLTGVNCDVSCLTRVSCDFSCLTGIKWCYCFHWRRGFWSRVRLDQPMDLTRWKWWAKTGLTAPIDSHIHSRDACWVTFSRAAKQWHCWHEDRSWRADGTAIRVPLVSTQR